MRNLIRTIEQTAIAIDQTFNALFGGYADETLSARAYRMSEHSSLWMMLLKFIDGLFFWQHNHCQSAYYSELERLHLPPRYRKDI